MTVAADAGVVRLGDERGERPGDDRVDGVAAALQRVEPRGDGERVPGGDDAAVRAHLGSRPEDLAESGPGVLLSHRHRALARYTHGRARHRRAVSARRGIIRVTVEAAATIGTACAGRSAHRHAGPPDEPRAAAAGTGTGTRRA